MANKPLILTDGAMSEGLIDMMSVSGLEILADPTIPHPTLALLFDSGLALDPRITFTRASQATYVDALGRIQIAGNNVPRLDYDPVTGVCKGLLVERAATNLFPNSGNPSIWANTNTTITPLDPDGQFAPVAVATNGPIWARLGTLGLAAGAGDTFTGRFYYRAGTSGRLRVVFRNHTTTAESTIVGPIGGELEVTQVAGAIADVRDREIAGGIREITATFTIGDAGTLQFAIGPDTVNVGEDIIVYGAQLETGTSPSSYIPTEGSPATRAADTAAVTDLSDWFNPEQGTLLAEFTPGGVTEAARSIAEFSNGTNANRTLLYLSASSVVSFWGSVDSATYPASLPVVTVVGETYRAAMSLTPGSLVAEGTVAEINLPEMPPVDRLDIGFRTPQPLSGFNGHIRKILYFPRRLTDEQLRRLTAP